VSDILRLSSAKSEQQLTDVHTHTEQAPDELAPTGAGVSVHISCLLIGCPRKGGGGSPQAVRYKIFCRKYTKPNNPTIPLGKINYLPFCNYNSYWRLTFGTAAL
jgi:hypothetical protein